MPMLFQLRVYSNNLKKKGPHLAKNGAFFDQDNKMVHTCMATEAECNNLDYESLQKIMK